MSFKQKLVKILTPKNTDEVKPKLYVQTYNNPDSLIARLDKTVRGHQKEIRYPKYRQIYPAAWNNRVNWKITILGAKPIKSFFVFLLILFLAWSYWHDVSTSRNFQVQLITNATARGEFCSLANFDTSMPSQDSSILDSLKKGVMNITYEKEG